jgi:hypothetical protein
VVETAGVKKYLVAVGGKGEFQLSEKVKKQ